MINKINPLYILLFLIFIASIVWYKGVELKGELEISNRAVIEYEKEAKEIRDLKRIWDDKQRAKEALDLIHNSANFQSAGIKREEIRRGVERVELNSVNFTLAEQFTNRVLNAPIKIENLVIKRDNDNNMSVVVEVKI